MAAYFPIWLPINCWSLLVLFWSLLLPALSYQSCDIVSVSTSIQVRPFPLYLFSDGKKWLINCYHWNLTWVQKSCGCFAKSMACLIIATECADSGKRGIIADKLISKCGCLSLEAWCAGHDSETASCVSIDKQTFSSHSYSRQRFFWSISWLCPTLSDDTGTGLPCLNEAGSTFV